MTVRHRSLFLLWALVLLKASIANAEYACDEAKCRAERIHPWVDNDTEYCCWVATPTFGEDATAEDIVNATEDFEQDLLDPRSGYCADGYLARIVTEVLVHLLPC
jgi:hypothetical protein